MKTCTKCGTEKPFEEFYKDKSGKDGRRSQCKECGRERNREWYQQNSERHRECVREWYQNNRERKLECDRERYRDNHERIRDRVREWQQNNPEKRRTYDATRRVRKRGNLTKTDLQQSADYRKMLEGTPCHYCGTTEGPFHIDHKQPISRGGDDHWSNLVNSCSDCNLRKSDKTYQEFTGTPDLTHYCVQR